MDASKDKTGESHLQDAGERGSEDLQARIEQLEEDALQNRELVNLGRMADGIAHDLNNLLMGVLGNADLIMAKIQPDAQIIGNVKDIITAARRTMNLTQQILAYSGRGDLNVEPVDLSDSIHAMSHLVEGSIADNVSISYDLEPNIPAVQADFEKVAHVVINLVKNASEALSEKGGIIFLTTGVMECDGSYLAQTYAGGNLRAGYYAFIEVADTGDGMEKEDLERIFDPGYTSKPGDRGLGLASVLGIMRAHHGSLRIYSEPGEGTVVKVLFPSKEQQTMMGEMTHDNGDWTAEGTVLIIDDEELLRSAVGDMLQMSGYDVLTAAGGLEGIELFREHTGNI